MSAGRVSLQGSDAEKGAEMKVGSLRIKRFVFSELPEKVFCPVCHKLVKSVVPSGSFLYLVHAIDNVCVVDNVQGHWD